MEIDHIKIKDSKGAKEDAKAQKAGQILLAALRLPLRLLREKSVCLTPLRVRVHLVSTGPRFESVAHIRCKPPFLCRSDRQTSVSAWRQQVLLANCGSISMTACRCALVMQKISSASLANLRCQLRAACGCTGTSNERRTAASGVR